MYTGIDLKYQDDLFIICSKNHILFMEVALEPVEAYLHLKGFFSLKQNEIPPCDIYQNIYTFFLSL